MSITELWIYTIESFLVTTHSNIEVILKTEIMRNTVCCLCSCNTVDFSGLCQWENDQYIETPAARTGLGLTPIVTTTMPVANVHCVRHNTCHVTYTVTSPMCTRAERLTRAVESLAVHMHSGKAYEGTCRIPRQNGDGRGIASARFVWIVKATESVARPHVVYGYWKV